MAKRDDAKGKLTGRHVLFIVLAFFGVMIFANVVFIRVSRRYGKEVLYSGASL